MTIMVAPTVPETAMAPVVLAATNVAALDFVPLDILRAYAVDIPDDPGALC